MTCSSCDFPVFTEVSYDAFTLAKSKRRGVGALNSFLWESSNKLVQLIVGLTADKRKC